MTDHAGHIRNPLTVISIFAGIAEISGTVVLPFIAPENQGTYIWFLMLFPALLVVAFFLTLNLNHKTLYAPSDYQNQNHFLSLFGIVTPDEKETKLNEEVLENNEATGDAPPSVDTKAQVPATAVEPVEPHNHVAETISTYNVNSSQKEKEEPNSTSNTIKDADLETDEAAASSFDFLAFAKKSELELKSKLKDIEKRSIQKLREVTHVSFAENVKFDIPNLNHPLIFDAIAHQNETIHIAEVKYFDKQGFSADRFNTTLANANIAAQSIYNVSNRKVVLHLVVVLNHDMSPGRYQNVKISLLNAAQKYSFQTKVYVISEHGLLKRGVPGSWLSDD